MAKIQDLTICPALFNCYIAKKLKNGRMSQDRKVLSEQEMEELIIWYAQRKIEPGHSIIWTLSDGSKVQLMNQESKSTNE